MSKSKAIQAVDPALLDDITAATLEHREARILASRAEAWCDALRERILSRLHMAGVREWRDPEVGIAILSQRAGMVDYDRLCADLGVPEDELEPYRRPPTRSVRITHQGMEAPTPPQFPRIREAEPMDGIADDIRRYREMREIAGAMGDRVRRASQRILERLDGAGLQGCVVPGVARITIVTRRGTVDYRAWLASRNLDEETIAAYRREPSVVLYVLSPHERVHAASDDAHGDDNYGNYVVP
ncbi:MAG: hypothetical protein NZM07_09775 [Elioraea sp.]|nr:hypothetical protein [Elioraea sp.]